MILNRFYEKGTCGTNIQIRIAALNSKMCYGIGGPLSSQRLRNHWLFDFLWLRETVQTTIAVMDLGFRFSFKICYDNKVDTLYFVKALQW